MSCGWRGGGASELEPEGEEAREGREKGGEESSKAPTTGTEEG